MKPFVLPRRRCRCRRGLLKVPNISREGVNYCYSYIIQNFTIVFLRVTLE